MIISKNIINRIFLIFHILITISPFILIGYHLYSFAASSQINMIPFAHMVYNLFGLDLFIDDVSEKMKILYEIYVFIFRLPLLFWLFILAIPSFIKLYHRI